MRWADFEAEAPGLAGRIAAEFASTGVVLVGTIRADGGPRVSPVEPVILDGDLYLDLMWRSMKARDLLRDPRCEVHAATHDRLGPQLKAWGQAIEEHDTAVRKRFATWVEGRLGWVPYPQHHLFRVDFGGAAWVSFSEDAPDGWMRVRTWTPGSYHERGPFPPSGSGEGEVPND